MGDIREKAAAGQNPIEKILLKIPGFRGYLQKEYRRETDQLFRQYLAQRLAEGKKRLNEAIRSTSGTGGLALLSAVDPVAALLEKVENRVRFASHGYSGFFDAVKIGEAELDGLYAFDQSLLSGIDEIVAGLGKLEGLAGDPAAFQQCVRDAQERLRSMDTRLNDRDNAMLGLAGK